MPQQRPTLDTAALAALADASFAPSDEDLFGLELEWPVHRHGDVGRRPGADELAPLDGTVLPGGGRITFEPGGQVELSTAPFASVPEALRAARSDSRIVFARLAAAGFTCETRAVDDRRSPERVLTKPRYRAMDAFFAARGRSGLWMMTNTTATQINVSHDPRDPALRWRLLDRIAPVLIATFANSPGLDIEGRRWTSLRQAIWWSLDPSRTRPVRTDLPPPQAWLEYALAADVMFIGDEGPAAESTPVPPGLSFAQWMRDGHPRGWPTVADFQHHVSTLFPPIRPRGWLELRVLDALPEWIRDVAALCVATACTPQAGRELLDRLPATDHLWLPAIRDGLQDDALASIATEFLDVVEHHLASVAPVRDYAHQVAQFRDRYTGQRRSPGHDLDGEYDMRLQPRLAEALAV